MIRVDESTVLVWVNGARVELDYPAPVATGVGVVGRPLWSPVVPS